jgi:hypothetical protein
MRMKKTLSLCLFVFRLSARRELAVRGRVGRMVIGASPVGASERRHELCHRLTRVECGVHMTVSGIDERIAGWVPPAGAALGGDIGQLPLTMVTNTGP